MDSSVRDKGRYVFGPFVLDPRRRVLMRGQQPVSLTPTVFDLLLHLVENAGRIVTKDELFTAIWPNRVVSESSLSQAVFVLRRALSDAGGEDRYVSTAPGRGYRFTETVRAETGSPAPSGFSPERESPPTLSTPTDRRGGSWVAGVLLAAAVVAGLGLAAYVFSRKSGQASSAARLPSIAVLAFQPTDGGERTKATASDLSAGVADALSHYNVTVVRATPPPPQALDPKAWTAGSVGSDFVVDGRVAEKNGKLVVTTELVSTGDKVVVYSFETPWSADDKSSLADAIAGHVALSLDPSKFVTNMGGKLTAEDYTIVARGNDAIDRGDVVGYLGSGSARWCSATPTTPT